MMISGHSVIGDYPGLDSKSCLPNKWARQAGVLFICLLFLLAFGGTAFAYRGRELGPIGCSKLANRVCGTISVSYGPSAEVRGAENIYVINPAVIDRAYFAWKFQMSIWGRGIVGGRIENLSYISRRGFQRPGFNQFAELLTARKPIKGFAITTSPSNPVYETRSAPEVVNLDSPWCLIEARNTPDARVGFYGFVKPYGVFRNAVETAPHDISALQSSYRIFAAAHGEPTHHDQTISEKHQRQISQFGFTAKQVGFGGILLLFCGVLIGAFGYDGGYQFPLMPVGAVMALAGAIVLFMYADGILAATRYIAQ
jgi:hypothetical protein